MADIRIKDLPLEAAPAASEFVAIDLSSTRRATIQDVVEIGRPTASQAEAEAGVNSVKSMSPLTVKQSIASEVGVSLASAGQGLLASTALQPAAIGTTVQAFNADLTAIAGLTSAADKVPYATGSGTWALADFTSAGRALVGAANAGAQRTALGLGGAAVLNVGTAPGTVAAGDDSRIVSALQPTATATVSIGTAVTNLPYYTARPTDYGAGKPGFNIRKTTTANKWQVDLFDGVNSNGTINFFVQNLTLNDSPLLTSAGNLGGLANLGTAQNNLQVDAAFADIATAVAATIPSRNVKIRTQCYDTTAAKRQGGAHYRESSAVEVAKYPSRASFTSNGGTRYWLLNEIEPNAFQLGGIGDGVADDAVALQQLLNFWSPQAQLASGTVTTRPLAMAGGGPVLIPKGVWRHTTTLSQNAYVSIRGDGMAMFPQAPMDGTTYGQYNFPNATILRPDFAAPDRALGVGIQTSPYVLTLAGASPGLAGQTVGTRFRSLMTLEVSGPDIDNGCLSYCESSNISDLTIWPVNEIFAGVRWTAAAKANIERVGVRNVKRCFFPESAWESNIQKCGVFDYKDCGIYGGGNVHAFGVRDNWMHGGGRVLAGDRPIGIYASFFDGLEISANSIEDLWDGISLSTGAGAIINANSMERISNVWLTTNAAYGVRGGGNHIIQNVIDARTFTNSLIWDGNDCEVDIQISASNTHLGTGTFPGKTYLQGVNPNTGANTALASATVNRTSVTFQGMRPLAGDAARVNRLSGNIRFLDDTGEWQIGGGSLGNQYVSSLDLKGDAGIKSTKSFKFNGTDAYYMEQDAVGVRVKAFGTNTIMMDSRASDGAFSFGGGVMLITVFGDPNTFVNAPKGSLVCDTNNGKLWIKTTAAGTLTGWVVVGTQT